MQPFVSDNYCVKPNTHAEIHEIFSGGHIDNSTQQPISLPIESSAGNLFLLESANGHNIWAALWYLNSNDHTGLLPLIASVWKT